MSSEIAPAGDKDLPLILYVLYATAASLTYALLETIFWGKDTSFISKMFTLELRERFQLTNSH